MAKVQEYLVTRFGGPSLEYECECKEAASSFTLLVDWRSPVRPLNKSPFRYRPRLPKLRQGVVGGELLACSETEAIVTVPIGGIVTVFFTDGAVRAFAAESAGLKEVKLSTVDYFICRAVDARERVDCCQTLYEMVGVALGVIDLFYLSTMYEHRSLGKLIRHKLLHEFFVSQRPEVLAVIRLDLGRIGRRFDLCREIGRLYPRRR